MKKVTSKQNIAIIVLSVLLLISIGFGATYSYFNGRSNTLTNNGKVTLATMTVDFTYEGKEAGKDSTTPFTLHSSGTRVVPGQPLSNIALAIDNKCPVDTYMVVVYSLHIIETETINGEPTEVLKPAPEVVAMDIREESVGDGWRKNIKTCRDEKTLICMLVYMGDNGVGDGIFHTTDEDQKSKVLDSECLKVPESWGNDMQGKTVTLTFTAYVIQAEAISNAYPNILPSKTPGVEERTDAIAQMFIDEFNLDTTEAPAPVEPGQGE